MTFDDILEQAIEMLRRRGRLTYRALKRQFDLDDDYLDDLKEELIYGQRLAMDEDERVLVWTGNTESASPPPTSVPAPGQVTDQRPLPISYTPQYLTEKILTTRNSLEGERKQVTVMFADIKDSTELIRDLDPEAAQQLLDPAIHIMMDAVHRFEGTVNQVLGDGIMAIFGAPIAHEDHAARACYAALAMQAAMQPYADEVRREYGVEMLIRVGLNSGEVVVRAIGNDLHMDYSAVGQTTHLAARMEQLAAPGSIRLPAHMLRLVEGWVQVKALGPVPIKGLTEPLEVHELVGVTGIRSRLQAAVVQGWSRFVGRQEELQILHRALERAQSEQGQVVAVVGEAGVGKSRLCFEFLHSHRTEPWLVLETGAVPYGKTTSHLLIIDLLKQYLQIDPHDTTQHLREKVTGKILTLDAQLQDIIPPLLSLLDALPEDDRFWSLSPRHRQSFVLDALKRLLLRESQRQPLLLVFEDLHWVDAESQTAIEVLVESLPTSRVLLLTNYRPEYNDPWTSKTYYTRLRVDPLGPQDADALLQTLLGDDASLESLKTLLKQRTGGNPFFLEESVRTLVEIGQLHGQPGAYRIEHDLPTVQIPSTVQALIAARIDRLPAEEKRLLQSSAVIGTEVPLALLHDLTELSDDALQRSLAALQAAEFLYETRLFPDAEYTFKHALTHDVAYEGLLHEHRRQLHQQVGERIEARYADRLNEFLDTLAHHFERGEDWGRAVNYHLSAAEKMKTQYAYRSAVRSGTRALALTTQDQGLEADRQRGLVMLGDLWSLLGDIDQANQNYEQAFEMVTDVSIKRHIANKCHHQHTVVRDGAKVAYYIHGSGDPTLILSHPIVYGLATFQPVVERLCQEFRIITIDPRGTGASDPLTQRYTLKEHAEDVRAVIEDSWSGPVVAVGSSRGGTLMTTVAAAYPSLVQKLVLANSHASPSMTYAQVNWIDDVRHLIRQGNLEQAVRIFVSAAFSEPGMGHFVGEFVRSGRVSSPEIFLNFITPDPEDDVVTLLPQIHMPTLVMHGTADRLVPFASGRYLAEHIAGARFYELKDKGHGLISTATNTFCEVLRCFVRTGELPETDIGREVFD